MNAKKPTLGCVSSSAIQTLLQDYKNFVVSIKTASKFKNS